jgi:hypothetical protein
MKTGIDALRGYVASGRGLTNQAETERMQSWLGQQAQDNLLPRRIRIGQ